MINPILSQVNLESAEENMTGKAGLAWLKTMNNAGTSYLMHNAALIVAKKLEPTRWPSANIVYIVLF